VRLLRNVNLVVHEKKEKRYTEVRVGGIRFRNKIQMHKFRYTSESFRVISPLHSPFSKAIVDPFFLADDELRTCSMLSKRVSLCHANAIVRHSTLLLIVANDAIIGFFPYHRFIALFVSHGLA
jgi:hypothetical protein